MVAPPIVADKSCRRVPETVTEQEHKLLQVIRKLPIFSETNIVVIKRNEQMRLKITPTEEIVI